MAKTKGLKPGQPAPRSGQYRQRGPNDEKGPEVTAVKGKPLPPPPEPGVVYDLVDLTKHKSGK